ncbi:MAG TPA: hypothetical protein VGF56_05800 [Rhizomicrobium sp.]
MAYTQADLDAINRVLATGANRVELPSVGLVGYRPVDEILKIKALIEADVNAGTGKKTVRRVKVFAIKDL